MKFNSPFQTESRQEPCCQIPHGDLARQWCPPVPEADIGVRCMRCLTPLPLLALIVISTGSLALADQPPRLDALGDPLPPQALLRIGTTRLGHASRLDHVALSADGKTLVTVATFTDPSVCVWDASDGKRRFRQEVPTGSAAQGIALSPDGKKVALVTVGTGFGPDATL